MLRNKKVSGAVAAAVLAAMNVTAFAGAAEARDWNSRGDRGGYAYNDRGYDRGQGRYDGRYAYRKDKSDKKLARGIAIGLGVVLLGSILASQANHGHGY